MKLLITTIFFGCLAFGDISTLNDKDMRAMNGVSMHNGCPVSSDELRNVSVKYHDFNGDTFDGTLVVHRDIAHDVEMIFKELYEIHYPIARISPIEKYKGSDFNSIEADNTSAFNCRKATGETKYSKHAYGKAIDINPIENPYIFRSGNVSHKASNIYKNRNISSQISVNEKAMLLPNSKAVEIFKRHGWRWGGDWNVKDYQHFDKQ